MVLLKVMLKMLLISINKFENFQIFRDKNSMFSNLDYFYNKDEVSIENEYNTVISKPGYGPDLDPYLIVIIDNIINETQKYSDNELKLISSLLKLRRTGAVVTFKQFYITMYIDFSTMSINRNDEVNKILEIFNLVSRPESPIDFSKKIEMTPYFKYETICSYSSPKCNERYSVSDDLTEIPFDLSISPGQNQNQNLVRFG